MLEKTKNKLPSVEHVNWEADVLDTSDMLIPRINLMQAMSTQVSDGKAAPGDLIESVNNEVLAKLGSKVELIPIMTFKEWYHYEIIPGESVPEYLGKEPWTPQNANTLKKEERGGKTYRNDMVLNFFVLSPSRLNDLPFLISFKKSSYNAGKKLSTHFQMAPQKKYVPWQWVFDLSAFKSTYEKYTFFVMDVTKTRECKKEEFEAAQKWRDTLSRQKVEIDTDREETSSRLAEQATRTVTPPTTEEEIPL